jgi:hypothetical protein
METNQLIFILGVLGLITWAGIRLLAPFATTIAQRLRRPATPAIDDSAMLALRQELDAVQDRLDFVERVIASQRSASPIGPPPAQLDAPGARTPTPV